MGKRITKGVRVVKKEPVKRLFFDIETTPNIVLSWNIGYKINLSYDNILEERKIICICYKWAKESTVHHLTWDSKHNDKSMLEAFIKVANTADILIGHNGDNFDIKWLRARCIYHNIPMPPNYDSIDTLKLSRTGFRFNSNRLDYIGGYLGLGNKIKTDYNLWKKVMLDKCKKSLQSMVTYCKRDVQLLENVYNKLMPYSKHSKSNAAAAIGGRKIDCPECGDNNTRRYGIRYTALGTKQQKMLCNSCHKHFTVSHKTYEQYVK